MDSTLIRETTSPGNPQIRETLIDNTLIRDTYLGIYVNSQYSEQRDTSAGNTWSRETRQYAIH